ncbi:ribonuclease HI [Helicobacter muridarum]|uniref:ribonuclease H n=1 Tax=Helicobacter muridarum TaxID=216 RepID=A0A099U1H0_9HELI|nr:ribonuclease HI [Helicobacter muridarum]TLE00812.1 ribonuclease HI [Helicobacter muridarum]STQ86500.1 ribonuclease H [Helicobacter muridarum]
MKKIKLYTDGSSLGNPGPSGYCALLEYTTKDSKLLYKQVSGGEPYSTNGRMELKAVIEGLKMLKEPCEVVIISDSKYICDSITTHLPNWLNKGFKDVKHTDLWGEYVHLSQSHEIEVQWVKAHNGHSQNEHCDKIARENAKQYSKQENDH